MFYKILNAILLISLAVRLVPCGAAENPAQKALLPRGITQSAESKEQYFHCDPSGYVRHWAVAGPRQTPYTGQGGNDQKMRREALDDKLVVPPQDVALGSASPLGETWRFYCPGENIFVECTAFYPKLTVLDYYACTEIHADRDASLPARFWVAGKADFWLNEVLVTRAKVPRGHRLDAKPIQLSLHRGTNRLCVRLQALGVRDTRMGFGVQILEGAEDLAIQLPGPAEQTAQLVAAERWLQGVKPRGRDSLISAGPAPVKASVEPGSGGKSLHWRPGESQVSLDPAKSFQVQVACTIAGQKLERLLEIPANHPLPESRPASIEEHRRRYLMHVAAPEHSAHDVFQVLARRLTGSLSTQDTPAIDKTLRDIESRKDCSDFTLAALLRLYALGKVSDDEAAKIKRVAVGFRYWMDEPGTDAMCFDSENHALLFHSGQLVAGRLFPDEVFANSGRRGSEQATLAAKRCRDWLEQREQHGFTEFFSSSYAPITLGALMNVVDFSGDADLSRRAAVLVDRIFVDLATQSFQGVTVAPQGRVYRNVLYPADSGTQGLLSWATTTAAGCYASHWVTFLASSATYRLPAGIEPLLDKPVSRRSRQADAEIVLHKSPAYLLTSLAIPATFSEAGGKSAGLRPGDHGYQQHVWHATLGPDCHVFVNHPGASFDLCESRPGFWYGNGVLPRTDQREGRLMQIFDIPESHPIGFTHAHWPADVFERQEVIEQWAFGAKGKGCIALWCSQPLQPHDDVLSGRELRAWGRRVAWLCVCADVKESGGFEGFKRSCLALAPSLDSATRTLRLRNGDALSYP